ncbi:MAG: ATP-binding protein [Methanoregula sp.]|nr:ATP-binding protein [Methanoregula sp.]
MKSPLRTAQILTILFLFLMVFITVSSIIFIDNQAKETFFDLTRNDLKGSASIIAAQISGDEFSRIQQGDESTPAYISLQAMLVRLKQSNPSIRYVYTMRQNGSSVEFVVDADNSVSENGATIGERYEYPSPDLLRGFFEPSAEIGLTTDKWGTTLSGFAPLRDSSGHTVGLVGVDMDNQLVIQRMQYINSINYAFLAIILILFSLGAILLEIRRSRIEATIERGNEKINVLNNIIRHDIFNTLTGLIGYEEMAQQTDTLPEIKEKLETISALTRKIQQQVTFTRDYQNLGIAMPLWQNIGEIVAREVSGLDNPAIAITMDFSHLEIFADPLLERAFHHLFDNALRHGETITKIKGYYERKGSDLILIIEDNGIGIPAKEKEAIFRRQFYKNTGLGLFLVQAILSMTSLTIRETGTPGNGARFEIIVPKGNYRFTGQRKT